MLLGGNRSEGDTPDHEWAIRNRQREVLGLRQAEGVDLGAIGSWWWYSGVMTAKPATSLRMPVQLRERVRQYTFTRRTSQNEALIFLITLALDQVFADQDESGESQ